MSDDKNVKSINEIQKNYYQFTALIKKSAVEEKKSRQAIINQMKAVFKKILKQEKNNTILVFSGSNDFPTIIEENQILTMEKKDDLV